MSVFRVALNNASQGLLDLNPSTASAGAVTGQGLGDQQTTSVQRGVYVMGPNKINRLLIDGETFTDCNYWKRFAYPQVPLNEAIVSVVTDDGSVYSDIASENVYPKVYNLIIVDGTSFDDANNLVDIASDTGGYAVFAQITNNSGGQDLRMRINGVSDAVMDLPADSTQVFNAGDLSISKIEFSNAASGTVNDCPVQVVLSIRSFCNT
jgi:hypothetical protein